LKLALRLPLHQQFAVEHAFLVERLRHVRKTAGDVVTGPAVQPRGARDAHQLHADAVPFPFRGIIGQADRLLRQRPPLQRMGEHERPEHRHVARPRLLPAPLRPGEERQIRRPDAVPHFLDRIDIQLERLRQRRLRQPCADPDPQLARSEFEQGIAAARVEMVEHLGNRRRGFGAAERRQPLDHRADAQRPIIDLGRLIGALRPQQGHRLGHVADIVPAHPEQDRVYPLFDQRPYQGRLH
jgi:hypothetical protein